MTIDDDALAELRELEARGRLRVPRVVERVDGPYITIDGRRVLNASSNDYLGLAGDARLARAAMDCLDECGVGAGASRLVVGNHRVHERLEQAIGEWMRRDGVVAFASGYAANTGVLTTLLRAGDVVFSDELNHASIVDGCRLSSAEIVVYPHRDVATLERALREHSRARRRVIVSETLFSMDGDVADVEALAALARRFDATLVVDEAHAVGVIGEEGRGVAARAGVVPDIVVGTCGKALGTAGAFVATSQAVARLLWNRARPLVFSTAQPMAIAAATLAAIEIVRGAEGDEKRRAVRERTQQLCEIIGRGRVVDGPIVPVIVGDDGVVMTLMQSVLEDGVYAQGIRPPTVKPGSARLRLSMSARLEIEHVRAIGFAISRGLRRFT